MNLVGSSAGVLEGKVVLLSANNELRLSVATCSELIFFVVHAGDFLLMLGTQALFVRPTRNARLQNPFRTKSTPGLVELTCVPVWLVKLLEKTVARLDWWRGEQHALSGRY